MLFATPSSGPYLGAEDGGEDLRQPASMEISHIHGGMCTIPQQKQSTNARKPLGIHPRS